MIEPMGNSEKAAMRFGWWSLVLASVVCALVGICYLTGAISGSRWVGAGLLLAGVVGLFGVRDARRWLPRD